MRRELFFITFGCCVWSIQTCFAASGDSKKIDEFRALITWAQQKGVRQNLGDGIPETLGLKTRRIEVLAYSFNEVEANAKHVFCVGASPNDRKYLFFILMDIGDGTAVVWRVSSLGKLIATICTAAGAAQAVPNAAFAAEFLAEKEYFLRAAPHYNPRNRLTTPATDGSIP